MMTKISATDFNTLMNIYPIKNKSKATSLEIAVKAIPKSKLIKSVV